MSEPIAMSFTQEDLSNRARTYMEKMYGKPGVGNNVDEWMARFGLLYGFINEQFAEVKTEKEANAKG